MKLFVPVLSFAMTLISTYSYACREMSDYVVFAQDIGIKEYCYAISLPPEAVKNLTGKTTIHAVRNGEDKVVSSFDWYNRNLYLKCGELKAGGNGISLVRALYQYREPYKALKDEDYNVLEFYLDGKLIKKYTARELTTGEKSYWPTACGDKILWNIKLDYAEEGSSGILRVQFALKLVDFDLTTGEIIKVEIKPDKVWAEMIGLAPRKSTTDLNDAGLTAPAPP